MYDNKFINIKSEGLDGVFAELFSLVNLSSIESTSTNNVNPNANEINNKIINSNISLTEKDIEDDSIKISFGKKGTSHGKVKTHLYFKQFAQISAEYIPDTTTSITLHPQCFSGMDELKTDEFYPVKAYRAFYIADKARFARYRYTQQPTWMKGVAL